VGTPSSLRLLQGLRLLLQWVQMAVLAVAAGVLQPCRVGHPGGGVALGLGCCTRFPSLRTLSCSTQRPPLACPRRLLQSANGSDGDVLPEGWVLVVTGGVKGCSAVCLAPLVPLEHSQ
jgi:hypothetical protein